MSDKIYLKEITLPIVETGENETYSFVQTDADLDTAGDAADAKAVGDEISDLKQELNQEKKYQLLLDDSVPNTVQEYTFSGGAVSQVTHKRSGTTIRTDAFTYETSSITEVRTLNTGESMTIATNLETLETSVTYTAA